MRPDLVATAAGPDLGVGVSGGEGSLTTLVTAAPGTVVSRMAITPTYLNTLRVHLCAASKMHACEIDFNFRGTGCSFDNIVFMYSSIKHSTLM